MTALRAGAVALIAACLLLLGFAAALVVEDRDAVATLLLVFALVSVPALLSAVAGLPSAVRSLRDGRLERATAGYAALLALGHTGVVALSLRPGLDGELDGGDLAGAGVSAGLAAALVALAVGSSARTLEVRLVALLGAGVLVVALLALRAV